MVVGGEAEENQEAAASLTTLSYTPEVTLKSKYSGYANVYTHTHTRPPEPGARPVLFNTLNITHSELDFNVKLKFWYSSV